MDRILLMKRFFPLVLSSLLSFGTIAAAQGTDVTFGGLKADTSLPVAVDSDQLSVDQTTKRAIFTGNVVVTQGEMKLTAAEVEVENGADGQGIARVLARGGVVLVSGPDAAQGAEAVYTVTSGDVVMTGDVVLTQGSAAISGQKLVINLATGTGRMEGRVTTTFVPAQN